MKSQRNNKRARREKAYIELFGPDFKVAHDLSLINPGVDIYIISRTVGGQRFYTLITGGMSDRSLPSSEECTYARAELVMYVEKPKRAFLQFLRNLARVPFEQGRWIDHGTTLNNGDPPQPLFAKSRLNHVLLLQSVVSPDNELPELLTINGDPVSLLWTVPITTTEAMYIDCRELGEFLKVLDQNAHPIVLDEFRDSYV